MAKPKPATKLFGVALDLTDDPWNLELKHGWMANAGRPKEGIDACRDPYDAVTTYLPDILNACQIVPAGKFPVPSWLTPKPVAADIPLVNAQNIGKFYDGGGLQSMIQQLERFVSQSIFPARPVMVGVDHTATMGVISALATKYGPDNLSILVLDQHFDAVPVSVRVAQAEISPVNPAGGQSLTSLNLPGDNQDQLCCGSFWAYVLDEGKIQPENLAFIGVADYPDQHQVGPFPQCYGDFENRGCRFFPLELFSKLDLKSLSEFVGASIGTSNVYVSLDLDVGAYNFTWAARYMDCPGISAPDLAAIAS
jgi:hypothetical protein